MRMRNLNSKKRSRIDTRGRPIESNRIGIMFGATFGNLFASGPKLNYDVDPAFDARAFGVWTHARGRCKVRTA